MSLMASLRSMSGRRRAALVVLLVAVIASLAVGGAVWIGAPRVAPDANEATAWDKVLDGIGPDGAVSLETALQAFSLAVGPLPGVQMPTGQTARIPSGTGAIRWLAGYRTQLTDDQRAAVDRYLAPDPNAIAVAPPTGTAPRIVLTSYQGPGSSPGVRSVPAARTQTEDLFLRYLDDSRAEIARLLRRQLALRYTLSINATQKTADDAYTLPHFGVGEMFGPSSCEFRVNPSMFESGFGETEWRASMAHEMFHCFQAAKMSGATEWTDTHTARPWLIEGSAAWVGETIGGPSKIGLIWWELYLRKPEAMLFNREYSAVGFYLHMAESQVDPWLHLDRMMYADNVTAYHEAADPGGALFLDTWASGHVGETALGGAWVAKGPWSTSAHAVVTPVDIPPGGSRRLIATSYRGVDYRVTTDAELLDVSAQGHARMANDKGFDQVITSPLLLCVIPGRCKCPEGMKDTGPPYVTAQEPLALALTGAVDGSAITMKAESFEDRCELSPSATPRSSGKPPVAGGHGPPRCGQRCPSSNGDPHLRTVDGAAYDFQAAGEFTLLRTADGTVEVQTRQEPASGVEAGAFSNNSALAARLGDHRVAIYATPAGLELRVDGLTQIGTDPIELGGGRVERHADGVVIDLPDGTVVWALARGPYGINALVDPSSAAVEGGVGLIGRRAPGLGVPRLPDGSVLPAPLDRHEAYTLLYQRFADAWRVTDATSLFDYDSGTTTATYTLHDYPAAPKVATFQELDPAKAAAGRQACMAMADTELRDQCAFDVAATGDQGYVAGYVAIERVARQGSIAMDVVAPAASATPTTSAVANPPVDVLPAFHRLAGSALGPDGTLYLSVVMTDRSGRVLAIDPLTGDILREVNTTGAGLVAIAAGSVWVGESTGSTSGGPPCSITRLDASTFAVQATIATACHRVWLRTEFAAVGDDLWFVDPTTADAAGVGGSLRRIDPAINAVAASVPLRFADGVLRASATAIFYGEPTMGQFRLRAGESTLTRIGEPDTNAFPAGYPAGDGLWAVANDQLGLFTSAKGPDGTIDLDDADGGILVGADRSSVFLDRPAPGGVNELWRRYLDGQAPVRLAAAPTTDTGIGPLLLFYLDGGDGSSLLVGETIVAKLWMVVSRTDPAESALLVQGARLPNR